MMIRVKAFAPLREMIPAIKDTGEALLEFPEGTTLDQVIESLKLPPNFPLVSVVNGNRPDPERGLKDGDEVMVISPLSGG